jgi:hypothetical protein
MSNFQFKIYEDARIAERKTEKPSKKSQASSGGVGELYKDSNSTYRIFSRLYCNFVMPGRPIPDKGNKTDYYTIKKSEFMKDTQQEKGVIVEEFIKNGEEWVTVAVKNKPSVTPSLGVNIKPVVEKEEGEKGEEEKEEIEDISNILKEANTYNNKEDIDEDKEGEVEGDEILDKIGGVQYKERIEAALKYLKDNSNEFLTPEALETYSPKYLKILENIQDPSHVGLNLVYSQFRTLEGIGIFCLVLEKNGFARFKVKRSSLTNEWEMDIPEEDLGKPTYALYTGTETPEERAIILKIYNGEWDSLGPNLAAKLREIANNNNMGEIIKVLMITSSGSEGINLRNTRYVHIMEPYWHPVRTDQVIGRARRICSHTKLPAALQTVEVFVYLMELTKEQLESKDAIELKRKDLSKIAKVPVTSDQLLYEISEIKAKLSKQLIDAVKSSAFDCNLYNNGDCVNFGETNNTDYSYVPDYSKQPNDNTSMANKDRIKWTGYPISISGKDYVYREMENGVKNLYDKQKYLRGVAVLKGTLETNERGQMVFKQVL